MRDWIVVEKLVKRVARFGFDESPDRDPGSGKDGCAGKYVGIAVDWIVGHGPCALVMVVNDGGTMMAQQECSTIEMLPGIAVFENRWLSLTGCSRGQAVREAVKGRTLAATRACATSGQTEFPHMRICASLVSGLPLKSKAMR